MALTEKDFASFDDYRNALPGALREKPKGKFIYGEMPFDDGERRKVLLFGSKFDDLKKRLVNKKGRILALGTVATGSSGRSEFSPSTGQLPEKCFEELKIAKLAGFEVDEEEAFELETVPGMHVTVRQLVADVNKMAAGSRRWNHPALRRMFDDKAKQIEERVRRLDHKPLAKLHEELGQIEADARWITESLAEIRSVEPIVDGLKHTDAKNYAAASAKLKEARDAYAKADFMTCNARITNMRIKLLPEGPNYVPTAAVDPASATPLAPGYRTAKTTLESNIKRALAARSGPAMAYREEAERVELFFKREARSNLHGKLVDIDRKPVHHPDRRKLIGQAIVVVQEYIQGLSRGGDALLSKAYLEMLRKTHVLLKKRYGP